MVTARLKQAAKRIYCRFIKLKEAPRQVALGFSLGLMIGMTPFFGAHVLSAWVLASILGWSKIAAVIGVNITNVVTIPIIYPINYWVGATLLGASRPFIWPGHADLSAFVTLLQRSPMVLLDLFFGGLILGIPLAVGGYFFALRAIGLYRGERTAGMDQQPHRCLKPMNRSRP